MTQVQSKEGPDTRTPKFGLGRGLSALLRHLCFGTGFSDKVIDCLSPFLEKANDASEHRIISNILTMTVVCSC